MSGNEQRTNKSGLKTMILGASMVIAAGTASVVENVNYMAKNEGIGMPDKNFDKYLALGVIPGALIYFAGQMKRDEEGYSIT